MISFPVCLSVTKIKLIGQTFHFAGLFSEQIGFVFLNSINGMELYTMLSIFSLLVAGLSALVLVVYVIRYPQPMKVMNAVWPLTALWGGLAGLWAFFSFGKVPEGKKDAMKMNEKENMSSADGGMGKEGSKVPMDMQMPPMEGKMGGMSHAMSGSMDMDMPMEKRAFWQKVALSTFHCGAGCTLADLIGEGLGPFLLIAIGLHGIVWMWILDYILALLIGAYFQYAAIRPTLRQKPAGQVFIRALKIDFLSLTSWQIGMYAFSYLVFFVILSAPLPHDTWPFWYTMQLAMCVGFLFSYPMNWYLIKRGIKPAM